MTCRLALAAILAVLAPSAIDAEQWFSYTSRDGLAANRVWSVYQSADGAMWLATEGGGVSRFDGTWRTFTNSDGLADDVVFDMIQATDGAMWFATRSGASRYDGDRWQSFTTADGLPGDHLRSVFESADGAIWFGTFENGVSRLSGSDWASLSVRDGLVDDQVLTILQSSDGDMWFGTNNGVSRFDGATWQSFTTADGLADNRVISLAQSADGALWFATFGGGLSRFDGAGWRTYTTRDGLADNRLLSVVQSLDGLMWVGTFGGGVSFLAGNSWATLDVLDGLGDDTVMSVFQSAGGAMWFGTEEGGVSRLDYATWQTYVRGLVLSLLEAADGALWVGVAGGVFRFAGDDVQTYGVRDGLGGDSINAVVQSADGAIWFATNGGATRYDGVVWRTFTTVDGLADNLVFALYPSADGAMWAGTLNGVSRFDGEGWKTHTTRDGLAHNLVFAIAQARGGDLWFATDSGVSRFDGASWQTYTTTDGLADDSVFSLLHAADGAIWFGTRKGGVTRFHEGSWQSYSRLDGLGDDAVLSLFQALDGSIWAGTRAGGASRFDGSSWQTLTVQDGLEDNLVHSVLQTGDGVLWFATEAGLSRYEPPKLALVQTAITRFPSELFGSDGFFFECRGHEIGSERLPPLSYVLTGGTHPPAAAEWSGFRSANGFSVAGLDNGDWTFHVRARDRYGNVDPTPAVYSFTVDKTPPTALISSPIGTVHGEVEVTGSVLDNSASPDLVGYNLHYAPVPVRPPVEESAWRSDRFRLHSAEPVVDGVLALWDSRGLHGPHLLRVVAEDALGHVTRYEVRVDVVAAAGHVESSSGGRIGSAGAAELYLPPNAIERSTEITISPVPEEDLDLGEQLHPVGVAFDIVPADLPLRKTATLTLSLDDGMIDAVADTRALAVYARWDEQWRRIGGTFDQSSSAISVGLRRLGRLALVEDFSSGKRGRSIASLTCQPRAFSPQGILFGERTTAISFDLGRAEDVTVKVYDRAGRFQGRIVHGRAMNAGSNVVVWDGTDRDDEVVPEGLYIVTVAAGGMVETVTVGVVRD